MRIPT